METSFGINDHEVKLNSNQKNISNKTHYAIKSALETMKERCQKLQKRLTSLEDENLQLRIERHSVPGLIKKEPKAELSSLQKQVEELNRDKSLLCHHIYMVASENKALWGRLYKCNLINENTDNDTKCESLDSNTIKPQKSINLLEGCVKGKDDGMEEIPLKAVNNFIKNKPLFDCENNETSKSVDGNIKECEFNLDVDIDEESGVYEGLMIEVKRILDKLKNEKTVLKQQHEGLKFAFKTITKYIKEKQNCKNCVTLQEELEKEKTNKKSVEVASTNHHEASFDSSVRREPNFNISRGKENAFEDRICPLCTKFYPKSTPFDEFNEHVLSHFVEEPEQDSLMSNYEIFA